MDMSQYLGIFIDEAREHLQNLNDKLTSLQTDHANPDPDLINSIFRSAHTLKGSSGQMGFRTMMDLTHSMENVFDALRQGKVSVTATMIDALFEGVDLLGAMVDNIEQGGDDHKDTTSVMKKLQALLGGQKQEDKQTKSGQKALQQGGTVFSEYDEAVIREALEQNMKVVEAAVTLRNDCVLKAARALMVSNTLEGFGTIIHSDPSTEAIEKEAFEHQFTYVVVTDRSAAEVKTAIMGISEIDAVETRTIGVSDLKTQPAPLSSAKKMKPSKNGSVGKRKPIAKTIRVNLSRLDHLLNLFEEMVIERSRLEKVASSLQSEELHDSVGRFKQVSDQMQETILGLRMEPVEQVFNRFPRMVRSLARELNKKVDLQISGAETEIDRTVIDELGDPLMHMIRNSMDHGIEHPDVRQKIGKNPTGLLAMRAYHSGNHVFIEIEDDGAGINRRKVLKKAVEKGIVSQTAADSLTDKDVYHLLFESGFSTADKISDISGRGVGLDVVESKIHALGGTVGVDSTPGKGTKFTIKLPLTLSIINALLVRAGGEIYAIPITSIIETALERQAQIRSVNRRSVMNFRDQVVPIVALDEYLKIPAEKGNKSASRSIVLVRHGDHTVALVTDKLLGYQDIVVKPLGKYLKTVRGFSGATILGDGKVALILDCQELIDEQKRIRFRQNA